MSRVPATASQETSPFDARTAAWVLVLAEYLMLATDVFGDQARARDWLAKPHPDLAGLAPIDRLSSPAGAEQVQRLLDQERSRTKI